MDWELVPQEEWLGGRDLAGATAVAAAIFG